MTNTLHIFVCEEFKVNPQKKMPLVKELGIPSPFSPTFSNTLEILFADVRCGARPPTGKFNSAITPSNRLAVFA